jgi:biotin carboxylase
MMMTRRADKILSLKASSPYAADAVASFSSSPSLSSSTYVSSTDDRPFQKVLIANRGEIACRVIRTCQSMGIPTVALYSVADGPDCLHASMADERYQIGTGPHPTESYLLQDQVLDIAQRSGAEAIHPGYGVSTSRSMQLCVPLNYEFGKLRLVARFSLEIRLFCICSGIYSS